MKSLKYTALLVAAMYSILSPVAALAIPVNGQIDIAGMVNLTNSTFTSVGNADLNDVGIVIAATNDFASYVTPLSSLATLTDIDFTAPGNIWSVGGFDFTAASFSGFVNTITTKAFTATGSISGNGFDTTPGTLLFSTQGNDALVSFSSTTNSVATPEPGILALLSLGLIGLGIARRRKT